VDYCHKIPVILVTVRPATALRIRSSVTWR